MPRPSKKSTSKPSKTLGAAKATPYSILECYRKSFAKHQQQIQYEKPVLQGNLTKLLPQSLPAPLQTRTERLRGNATASVANPELRNSQQQISFPVAPLTQSLAPTNGHRGINFAPVLHPVNGLPIRSLKSSSLVTSTISPNVSQHNPTPSMLPSTSITNSITTESAPHYMTPRTRAKSPPDVPVQRNIPFEETSMDMIDVAENYETGLVRDQDIKPVATAVGEIKGSFNIEKCVMDKSGVYEAGRKQHLRFRGLIDNISNYWKEYGDSWFEDLVKTARREMSTKRGDVAKGKNVLQVATDKKLRVLQAEQQKVAVEKTKVLKERAEKKEIQKAKLKKQKANEKMKQKIQKKKKQTIVKL